jgi:ADP-heptose:LPS heptosyltransferase
VLNENCFVVTVEHMGAVASAKRILLCLRYGIGDVVMELPLLDALRRTAPNARITAIGADPATQLLVGSGLVNEIVAYGRWGIRHLWDSGGEKTPADISTWLSAAGFDLALDARYSPEPVRAAVRRTGIAELSTDEGTVVEALTEGANGAEALVRGAGSGWGLREQPHPTPRIQLSASEVEFAKVFLGRSPRALVGFCPAASSVLKRWPESRFATVADWAMEAGYSVTIFGDHHDGSGPAMRRLMLHGARCAMASGLHLRHVAAVLARCAALVSNDTGLMHIAAAVRTPVVAIFGPTSPRVFLPRGRSEWLAADVNCPHRTNSLSPPGCWHSERCLIAEDHCTAAVPTGAVTAALRRILRGALQSYSVRSATTGSRRSDHRTGR